MKKIFFIVSILLYCNIVLSQSNHSKRYNDSITDLLIKSKNPKKNKIERLVFVEKAKELSTKIANDSLVNICSRQIALLYWSMENYNLYKKSSQQYLKLSTKLKDSFQMGKANNYLGHYYYHFSVSDSAYFYFFQAEKIFRKLNNPDELAAQLLQIAIIQKNEKDFIGSEITTVEAISLIDDKKTSKILAGLYNNLGIIYSELGKYDEALKYYNKKIEIHEKIGSKELRNGEIYNNLAVLYKRKSQYKKALDYFEKILNNFDLEEQDPQFYAMVMDNYAHTKFLMGETEELPKLYFDALKICDRIDSHYRSIAINIHLSEYYEKINKIDSARHYGHQAKNLAKKFHNDDYLKALLNLSKIETDSAAKKYYQEYIDLSDSLIENERTIRNKFARIRYETKEIEERNQKISKERMYLLILSIGLLLTIFLTYIIITQRTKNKELKLNQLQQEANEEIYSLMLSQQDKIKEGRAQEKKRISEELHDGILGRLFGTRLSLDSLNNSNSTEAAKSRNAYIEELKSIEQEIRRISHDLNSDFVSNSGYFEMIENLVEKQALAYGLAFDLAEDENIDWRNVNNKTKINLYRIVQESLQNIYKHANAKHVHIEFTKVDQDIVMEIMDDGDGFDVNKNKKGIGIKNMNSRVKELKGTVNINSKINHGTTIHIVVPA